MTLYFKEITFSVEVCCTFHFILALKGRCDVSCRFVLLTSFVVLKV